MCVRVCVDRRFVDIRNGAPLVLRMAVEGTSGSITVRTDNMELAGIIIIIQSSLQP